MVERFELFTVLIANLTRNIRRIKTEEMARWNLKSHHVSCIYYLYQKESLTAKELCDICDEDKANVSRSIEYLEDAGFLICENTRSSYEKKMIEQPRHADIYNSRMDTWETARNLCIGAAATVYVVNIIDALCTKGAKRVKVKKNRTNISLQPYAGTNSVGVAFKF